MAFLEVYVREALMAEVRFVRGMARELDGGDADETKRKCMRELVSVHRNMLKDLGTSRGQLDGLIQRPLEYEGWFPDELNDLMPFILGFTNSAVDGPDTWKVEGDTRSVVEKDEDENFVLVSQVPVLKEITMPKNKLSPLRIKAMEDITQYLGNAKVIADIYFIVANN